MKKFIILHYGFEPPSPKEMDAWNAWFESITDRQIERGHTPSGKEITQNGMFDLPFGPDSMTGYTMIQAESLEEATQIAEGCPIVRSTRVYEVR